MVPDRPEEDDSSVEERAAASASEIAARQLASLDEAAELSGIEASVVVGLCERQVVAPAVRDRAGALYFDHRTVFQLKRVGHFREELGLDEAGAEFVLGLLERIDALERELRALRERVR